jgi:hypothetical protein
LLVYTLYLEKKVLKNDSKASEKLIKSKEFFIYKEKAVESEPFNSPELVIKQQQQLNSYLDGNNFKNGLPGLLINNKLLE